MVEPEELIVEVKADIAASFTYASFQNAIPVVRSISIENKTATNIETCELRLVSNPPFIRPKVWIIDRILSEDTIAISDRKVELDANYLAGLNEAERGVLTLTLLSRDTVLAELHISVRLLARDEWGGVSDMAQLLPAFVMPNDPAVAKLLRVSADRLADHGHSSAMDGYQSNDPKRSFMLAASVYSAIAGASIHYAEPPASFELRGQKIRKPSDITEQRLATCLDLSLLFAGTLEAAGLNPVILLFKGHAAVGVWLTKRTLANAIEPDLMEIRKAHALRELILLETVGLTHRPPMMFEQAQKRIEHRLDEAERGAFVAAIDIRRSRSGGITPLASHEIFRRSEGEDVNGNANLPLPPLPGFDDVPQDIAEEKPTTAASRIDRWQKKLLDLTLRNRLLNFSDTQKTIPFFCNDISYLEDRLSAGAGMRLISLPEQNPLGERDQEIFRETRKEDLHSLFATEALQRDELPSQLSGKELEKRLIELHRQVRNDFAEGGANTLFLAVGFLRWKKKPDDERSYKAPLLLIPVKLERKSASSRFSLRYHEDEVRFNGTLLQFLERDFDLRLPQFMGPLPQDTSGIDVPRVLASMRQGVRDVPGMEVVDETALSTFSFAKFLMWKDLVERTDALRQNRIVKHLIDTPNQPFASGEATFTDEKDIDRLYDPKDIICLLPADSSQIAASIAAAEGRDFVVVGPPGTGKSQTIANMIAHCLAVGKTVLFVAEKTAALEVVYRRLKAHGLGDHCLELHSNKADRKSFVGQLKQAWESGTRYDEREWIKINDQMRIRRDELNDYVDTLHYRHPNGLSAYQAIGVATRGIDDHAPALEFESYRGHDEAHYERLENIAADLGRIFSAVKSKPSLQFVNRGEWTSVWQEALLRSAGDVLSNLQQLTTFYNAFLTQLNLKAPHEVSFTELEKIDSVAKALSAATGTDVSIVFEFEFVQLRAALADLEGAILSYRSAEATLTAPFELDVIKQIPIEPLEEGWREASASIWPKSWLGQRKIRKLLKSYSASGSPDPARDLSVLKRLRDQANMIDANMLAGKRSGFAGLNSDTAAIERRMNSGQRIRESLFSLERAAEEISTSIQSLRPILQSTEVEAPARLAATRFAQIFETLKRSIISFNNVSGVDIAELHPNGCFTTLVDALSDLQNSRSLLRDWTAWCQIRALANANGLTALVSDIETGAVSAERSEQAFHLGYARWWLPLVIDETPTLREFRCFNHEYVVGDFRGTDDLVRKAAVGRVLTKLSHNLPSVQSVPRQSELGLLRHQMELQRPTKSIRDMISGMPDNFSKLAPCMMMSPLSIAQYLPPDQALFDVVIFDEASQITTWDAVGAIARGRQTIIVGDPKQLPPTNFFGRSEVEDDVEDYERDLESILDEAKTAGIPVRDLRWHYRSRNESLIAFSNHYYYQNRLITFPSPQVNDQSVRLKLVETGVYDRGKSRTNKIEARGVANEAVRRMRQWLVQDEKDRCTIGIITFNAQQQSLIQDYLDEARRAEPELEWFFSEDRVEPAIVRNLENVQGDERDVILFSITFAADAAGKRSMDFGALNRDGGERRLNVAVTRAREELILFSGFRADQIDTSRTKAIGVHHLKAFLDFAERGAVALPAQDQGSVGGLESPFEEAVANQLLRYGWQVVPQVGISGFRVDLGIKHPDKAGTYLAGVECDGATYHSSATARDRDKVREQVLTGLGWSILRVWSTDWWFDTRGAVERLHNALSKLLEESRAHALVERDVNGENFVDLASLSPNETGGQDELGQDIDNRIQVAYAPELKNVPPSAVAAGARLSEKNPVYILTDFGDFTVQPDKFYESSYQTTLRGMVQAVIETEAPLRDDILAQRIARAHGWLRTGSRIREQIELHLKNFDKTSETSGKFIWKKGSIKDSIPYRWHDSNETRRAITDIPLAELVSVVHLQPDLHKYPDPIMALARHLGVERLTDITRKRLEEAFKFVAKFRTD
jgi:very-short-patch-repair endonuclease